MKRIFGFGAMSVILALSTLPLFPNPAGALPPAPFCSAAVAVSVGNTGILRTASASGSYYCDSDFPTVVVGVTAHFTDGSSIGNGNFCTNCSSVSATASPAYGPTLNTAAWCAVGLATGAASASTKPVATDTICVVLQ